ncbi:MAG TPA: hypothetical protein VMH89_11890 [Candidatus Acidoferrum sp.]|nr:hypothetical protein [Candidatus Acidoferrum sp.]
MPTKRTAELGCKRCGEVREMASKKLCFNCYREMEDGLKRINQDPAMRRDRKKTWKAYFALTGAAEELGFDDDEMMALRLLADPHIKAIESRLAPKHGTIAYDVNGTAHITTAEKK